MITPDLAAAGPGPVVPARGAAGKAEAPAPETAFEAFVEGVAAEAEIAVLETIDPGTGLDTAVAPVPLPPVVVLGAGPPAAALAPAGPEAASQGEVCVALATEDARAAPAALPAAPADQATRAVPAATVPTGHAGADAEAEIEPAALVTAPAEPDTSAATAPATASPAQGAAEPRPVFGAAAMAAPEAAAPGAALQPSSDPGWRLAATGSRGATEAAPGPAAAARDVVGQITLAIGRATEPQVEIRLDPPELGRVQIRLNPIEGGISAVVLADRPETQDFLRRHAEALSRDLTEAGYGQVTLQFAAGGEAPPREAPPRERRFAAAFDTGAERTAAPEAARRTAAGGLDIRL